MKIAVTAVELMVAPSPQTTSMRKTINRISLWPAFAISQSPSRCATPVRTSPSPIMNNAAMRMIFESLKPASASPMVSTPVKGNTVSIIKATASRTRLIDREHENRGREQAENDRELRHCRCAHPGGVGAMAVGFGIAWSSGSGLPAANGAEPMDHSCAAVAGISRNNCLTRRTSHRHRRPLLSLPSSSRHRALRWFLARDLPRNVIRQPPGREDRDQRETGHDEQPIPQRA